MKRTDKKKLVLTKIDIRPLLLTPTELRGVMGATGGVPCSPLTPKCKDQF